MTSDPNPSTADAISLGGLYKNAPIATAVCNSHGRVVDTNDAMCRLLGYCRDELLQKTVAELTHPDDVARVMAQRQRLFAGETAAIETESRYRHKSGHSVWALMSIWAISHANSKPQYAIGQIVSLDKEKQMEQQLALARRQRDILVREVHHRIKNNLQAVTGLLHRQMHTYPELSDALAAAIGQIEAIAIMHGLQSVAHRGHLRLCETLAEIIAAANQLHPVTHPIALDNQMPAPLLIANDETVPLALILNELITNAVKHCRAPELAGVHITLQRPAADCAVVTIVNASQPLPEHFDFDSGAGAGMGLRLVRALLPRSGTDICFDRGEGTTSVQIMLRPPVIYTSKPGSEHIHSHLRERP